MPPSLAHLPSPPCSITPQVYAHLDSRLVPALSSRPGTPHACGRVLGGTEEQTSHPAAPYPLAPVPRRPALPPLMWVRFRLLLPQASCMSPSYGEKSSPLLRTPTDRRSCPRILLSLAPCSHGPGMGTLGPPLRDLESHSPHAPGLPQLGVERPNW